MQLYNVVLKASAYNSLNFDLGIDVLRIFIAIQCFKKISYTASEYSHFYSAPCRIKEVHLSIYHFLFYLLRRLLFHRVINSYFKEIQRHSPDSFSLTIQLATILVTRNFVISNQYKFIRVIRRKMKIIFDEV